MPGKALKIPPVLICLGDLLELQCGSISYRWAIKDGMKLYSSANGQKLYGMKAKPVASSPDKINQLANRNKAKVEDGLKLYQKWHEFDAAGGSVVNLKNATFNQIGRCQMILYRSDKWTGKQQRYYHDFKTPPIVWATSKTSPRAVILSGGKIRIKKEGITG